MPDSTVGIDISKTHLDAYMAPAGKAARFTNDAAGFNALIAWVDQPVRSVVYEPTGPWHRAFEEALLQAGLPLARANPLQARRFAQAMGQRAKTDAVDARVLAQMDSPPFCKLHLRVLFGPRPTASVDRPGHVTCPPQHWDGEWVEETPRGDGCRCTKGPRFARIAFTTHGRPRPSTRLAGPPLALRPSG